MRWIPIADVVAVRTDLNRRVGDRAADLSPASPPQGRPELRQAVRPVDLERGPEAIGVPASVPGLTPQEVRVTVGAGILTLDAAPAQEAERPRGTIVRRERFSGRLHRQVALGDGLPSDQARASVDHGVLTVTDPLSPVVPAGT
ncbi:MAG TPA: Hsp20/alpha crystallin family protein [Verrucomicrobiae bacterium]|nr:Hsp20/alpha crystallin family protein [Verrucomicrobiae bacterium]